MSDLVVKSSSAGDNDSDDDELKMPEIEELEEAEAKAAEPEEDTSLANSDVATKYQEAAKIAQETLIDVSSQVPICYKFYDTFPCAIFTTFYFFFA